MNMSLMGFGFYEKLGHLVEDSAEKEKGRVEFDAIRDRQIHIQLNKMQLLPTYMQV